MKRPLRLGVNIDHVATLRNARGGAYPDPLRAALMAEAAGADGITAHLREDRRHIRDEDILQLKKQCKLLLNLEIAATEEMLSIAIRTKPHAVCLVPEKREERTTEGGLDVLGNKAMLKPVVSRLNAAGIRVSLFINPDIQQVDTAKEVGAAIVELHTGKYCEAKEEARMRELALIQQAASHASKVGLECHAGHGLSFDTVKPIAAIADIVELNIGHFLIGEAIFLGLKESIVHMKQLMLEAR